MLNKILAAACVLTALAGCATSNEGASGGVNTMTFKVDGMACPNCAKELEHELEEVAGVKDASINFETKKATVQLDPEKPATRADMDAAIVHWKQEHFSAKEDPNCLDPQKREEMQKTGG